MLKRLGFQRSAMSTRNRMCPARTLRCEELESRRMLSVYYVDATDGNDSWDGTAGAYVSGSTGPWKTIQKVNSETQSAGDSVLFKRGETWREGLWVDEGSAAADVTYGAYGTGEKPLLLCSTEMNGAGDWVNLGGNIWSTTTGAATVTGGELLSNPSFDSSTSGWTLAVSEASATSYRDTSVYDSSPAGYSIDCTDNSGTIELYTSASIATGEYYKLTFRAKSTEAFNLRGITLNGIYGGAQWATSYTYNNLPFTTEWTTYSVVFEAHVTATARLTFHLSNAVPNGATFSIDTLSCKQCDISHNFLPYDVGNIIFDEGDSPCGVKEWSQGDLDAQGEYYYDPTNYTVKVYSTSNPGNYYSDIELALGRINITAIGRDHITVENLNISNTASVGISTGYSHNFTLRNCDFGFSGGVKWTSSSNSRFGGAVEIYGSAYNMLVENCKIWESFDAGITNQTKGAGTQHDIIIRNNIIWNCEYSYEYFQREDSVTYNIYFENNTCAYAGYGFAHNQRVDPNSTHMKLGNNLATISNFYIRNNIFYETLNRGGIWIYSPWTDLENLTLDNNLYYESSGYVASWFGTYVTLENFSTYVTTSGKDVNSIADNPEFVDAANLDFHLKSISPAINTGVDTGIAYDYDGNSRPRDTYYDMGAFEAEGLYGLPGDANLDGIANAIDATIMAVNWQRMNGATWRQGDFNRDGRVDDLDSALLSANWLRTLPPLAVSNVAATSAPLVVATAPEAETRIAVPAVSYDLDNSGKVDLGDLAFFATVYREKPGVTTENPYAYAADFDRSGTVDLGDLALFTANYRLGQPNDSLAQTAEASQSRSAAAETALTMAAVPAIMPGDANRDGRVDEHDAGMVARNWKTKKHVTWSDGDFNGDEIIDNLDAAILAQHWLMTNDFFK